MPLAEIDIAMTKAVAHYYYSQREAVSHEQLLRKFDDPRPMIRLTNLRIITMDGNPSPTYLPTILAFGFCGDDALLRAAKDSVTFIVRDLKNLFKASYDRARQYKAVEFSAQLETASRVPVPIQVELGLFLAKDIPGIIFAQLNDVKTKVVSFQINEHILTVDPEKVWDEHIRTYAPPEALTPQTVVVTQPATRETTKASGWPPPAWRIVEPLDEGGQGWTYIVRRASGGDKTCYVLKRLKNKQRLPRFRSEIAALSKLKHPGILQIVEIGESSEKPFFVTEYCEGKDLGKTNLARKDLLTKLRMFREICEAVAAAHSANILHRDLKPPNIFIRKDNSIVVGDFGLCIDLGDAVERATQTREEIGARNYIAPEVAKGRVEEPEPTIDIYSLGKVLYFMLSGRTLVREEYDEGADDLRAGDAGLAMNFVYELFDKTIKHHPQDRFQSTRDLLYTLDSVIERVQLKAHVLKSGVPQHCMFCVVGQYQASGPDHQGYHIFVCTTCGNVQRFVGSASWPGRK
jgi:hypothetical protein